MHLKSWTTGGILHADTLFLHHRFGTSLDKSMLLHGYKKHLQVNCEIALGVNVAKVFDKDYIFWTSFISARFVFSPLRATM